VKLCLAIGLLLVTSQAAAVLLGSPSDGTQCGRTTRAAMVERMKADVRAANARVLERFRSLNRESGGRESPPATGAATAEVDRVAQVLGSLIDIMQAADATGNALESAALFATIRDQVVYGGEKVAANARLSFLLYAARQEAEKAYQTINPALAKIIRSDVAADVATLRAAIEAVIRVLGSCLPPPQGAPGK